MAWQIYKIPFWAQGRKDNKNKTTNNTNCTKKHTPRVSHERGVRVSKCIWVGFWACWAPRPPTHGPKTCPNHDLLLICVPSGLICRRFLVHIFKNKSQCSCSLVCVRECILFNKTLEHWKWNKQVGSRAADILGTGAGLPKAIGMHTCRVSGRGKVRGLRTHNHLMPKSRRQFNTILNLRCSVFDLLCSILDCQHLLPSIFFLAYILYLLCSIFYLKSSILYLLSTIYYLPPTIYYLLSSTIYLLSSILCLLSSIIDLLSSIFSYR